ncbi:hypothetical protein F4805DRAFT_426005 [Annulohypoxylon moriforme]|nr:hypothetical protein F4805DRAFT_426005 [Annulohypoxylon moriforme]
MAKDPAKPGRRPYKKRKTKAAKTAEAKTAAPKTAAPDTAAPKTAAPKTAAPKTAAPKTAAPKTAAPKTTAPTTTGRRRRVSRTTHATGPDRTPIRRPRPNRRRKVPDVVKKDGGRVPSGGSGSSDVPSLPESEEPDEDWGSKVMGLMDNVIATDRRPDSVLEYAPGGPEDEPCIVVELEFLLALACSPASGDPHPADGRYLSRTMGIYYYTAPVTDIETKLERFKSYAKIRLLRVLRRGGLPAHEPDLLPDDAGSESEFDDDRLDWPALVNSFVFGIPPEGRFPSDPQREAFADALYIMFQDHFSNANASLRTMPRDQIEALYDKIYGGLATGPNAWTDVANRIQIADRVFKLILEERSAQRKANLLELEEAEDPDYTKADALEPRYRAWTVMEDVSVDGAGMIPARYNIPIHREDEVPMEIYRWFGAEVISPVMPMNSDATAAKIRQACSVLRDYFRIHKPMERSTGLHVHFGHKHGWNLQQMKRFVTLWIIIEPIIIHCHRKDRGVRNATWVANMFDFSKLSTYLFSPSQRDRQLYECEPRATAEQRDASRVLMNMHVPVNRLDQRQREYIEKIWCYQTLSEMHEAVTSPSRSLSARIRISGGKTSDGADYATPQTIEIRTMQGTIDANHINHWIAVMKRVMYYVRNQTADQFRELLSRFFDRIHGPDDLWLLLQLLEAPMETRQYFAHPYNRGYDPGTSEQWWMYPDRDVVDWTQPFMVKGHGATHGQQYDNMGI